MTILRFVYELNHESCGFDNRSTHLKTRVLTAWHWNTRGKTERDSLMAVEYQLRFLGYLPHPHWAVPSSCSHTALAAQAVQSCDGILMPKATARHSDKKSQMLMLNTSVWQDSFFLICHSQSFHICVLVHVPHFYWAIMWGAVQIMSPLSEWKALRREIHWYD